MSPAATACCIVGGGPAGMMLGFLLARAGVPVSMLEKHADFLRDFRGDTVHPSTLQVLAEVGLLEKFERLPQRRVEHLGGIVGGEYQDLVDLRGLKPFGHLALVPQWDFLDFIASEGRARYPKFDLRMRHEAIALIEENGQVAGVRVRTPQGESEIRAGLVVACDGRHSRMREAAGLRVKDFAAPMDVLWFRVPRSADDPEDTLVVFGAGNMMVLLNRTDYWQAAYVVPKGTDAQLRRKPIEALRKSAAALAPFFAKSDAPRSWDDVKTLEVRVDRLERWHRPGLLLIGDAAHAMSPVGGVGINLAIQDAVAAANALARPLLSGKPVEESLLQSVQSRRMLPTRIVQFVQIQVQKRLIAPTLAGNRPPRVPALLRSLLRFRAVRHIPARLVGYGIRQEHVRTIEAKAKIGSQRSRAA